MSASNAPQSEPVGAEAQLEGFFSIVETAHGEVIWEGVVKFDSAQGRCMPGRLRGTPRPQYIAVLRRHPIDSPTAAVRAWISSMKELR
jgi:hypothetical protein